MADVLWAQKIYDSLQEKYEFAKSQPKNSMQYIEKCRLEFVAAGASLNGTQAAALHTQFSATTDITDAPRKTL